MRIAVISMNNPAIYPALCDLATALAKRGAEVFFLSTFAPSGIAEVGGLTWVQIPRLGGMLAKVPLLRGNYHGLLPMLRKLSPDWVMAQHEYLVPALVYKSMVHRVRVAGYFSDYHKGRWYTEVLRRMASMLDAYVDVCDVRLAWRQRDWPAMKAKAFLVRQAPFVRFDAGHLAHKGVPRIVFTGSKYVLALSRDRLSRFLQRVCERGISVDWFLPGPEEVRTAARELTTHRGFVVRPPVDKSSLVATLAGYDAGLHWAPMAEAAHDPDYFLSAASNKIGEYIAAGLVVAHAGNPGLSYLPDDVEAVFDPTDPESGADQLASAVSDRASIERKRLAAKHYHLEEMNFEAQASALITHLIET